MELENCLTFHVFPFVAAFHDEVARTSIAPAVKEEPSSRVLRRLAKVTIFDVNSGNMYNIASNQSVYHIS